MKCPKCGYNSFEFHDSCKKCANDLTGYKDTYGLKSIVLPLEARSSMAETLIAQAAVNNSVPAANDVPVDMFSFDLPEEGTSRSTGNDPFNFDDEPVSAARTGAGFSFDTEQQSAQAKAEEDAFADLLESSSHEDTNSEAAASSTITGTADSDLNNFSWDDTPDPAPGAVVKPVEDDFNSLFGDMDDPAKK